MPVFHLANPSARTLAAATFLSSLALVSPPPVVSLAQAADVGVSPDATVLVQEAEPPTGPAQEKRAKQPLFDPIAERIKYLHDRLRIVPAQEPLWANVAQVMRDNATAVAPLIKEHVQNAQRGNAIDNLNSYEKLGEAQLDGLEKFIGAFRALYDGLSDEQKKIADSVFRLGPLGMVGGIPELPEQLVAPAPYRYYPSYPTPPVYPTFPSYPYYPSYSYCPNYGPWFWGPPLGLGASFFFIHGHHRRHEFHHDFHQRVGVPHGRVGVMHHR